MSDHLTGDQVNRFHRHTLPPEEFVAIDRHLAGCSECRHRLLRQAGPGASTLIAAVLEPARLEHLTYRQMEAYADGTLTNHDAMAVLAHTSLCPMCDRELRDLAAFASAMTAAALAKPAAGRRDSVSWWQRLSGLLNRPQRLALVGAAVAVALMVPLATLYHPTGGGGQNQAYLSESSSRLPDLGSLPAALRPGIERILRAGDPARPASLDGVDARRPAGLLSPVAQAVEQVQPVFRWESHAGNQVVVYDAARHIVASSGPLGVTEWRCTIALRRGSVHSWAADNQTAAAASFLVLSDGAVRELGQVRSTYAGSHEVLGAAMEEVGLLEEAEAEFQAAMKSNPQSALAARLLANCRKLRQAR